MLWLCIHLPALPLEALAPPADCPVAVVESEGASRKLIRVSRAARERGVSEGMRLASALSIAPELRALRRSTEAELAALESVACWALRYGTPATFSPATSDVWVEVQHSLRFFGGWNVVRRLLEQESAVLLFSQQHGVAPTLAGSALMARAGAGLRRPVFRVAEQRTVAADWPLTLLPFDSGVMDVLLGSGLRTIGELMSLPGDALARRFGQGIPRYLAQLLGREPEAWKSYEPPVVYRRRFEMEGAIETTEALLFPLRRMLLDFALYLRARDVAVQTFVIQLRDTRLQTVPLYVGLLAPTRDYQRMLLVVRERLEKVALSDPVQEIVLEAERFEAGSATQDDLFDLSGAQGERFDTLRERLAARLGTDAVRVLAVTSDHRPERAWSASSQSQPTASEHPPRPLWLLPKPRPIVAPRPLGPPERIEQGWWDGRQHARDYCVAEDAAGRRLWVYREPGSPQWYLHGLWQ